MFLLSRPGIPGPDSLSTLSTVTELLQLLLPPHVTTTSSKCDDVPTVETKEEDGSTMDVDDNADDNETENKNKDGGENEDEKRKDGGEMEECENEETRDAKGKVGTC